MRDNSGKTFWKTSYFSCSYDPNRHSCTERLKSTETTCPTGRQECPTQNKKQTFSTTSWSVSKEPHTLKESPPFRSRVREQEEYTGGNPLTKHITCASDCSEAVQKLHKPSSTVPSQYMLFRGSERSNCHTTMLLPCLFLMQAALNLFLPMLL